MVQTSLMETAAPAAPQPVQPAPTVAPTMGETIRGYRRSASHLPAATAAAAEARERLHTAEVNLEEFLADRTVEVEAQEQDDEDLAATIVEQPRSWMQKLRTALRGRKVQVDLRKAARVEARAMGMIAELRTMAEAADAEARHAAACAKWLEHSALTEEVSHGMGDVLEKVLRLQAIEEDQRLLAVNLAQGPCLVIRADLLPALDRISPLGQQWIHHRQPHVRERSEAIFREVASKN